MRTRTPLLIVFAAFAASAALLILQTLVFQLLAYDSTAIGALSVAFRVGFVVADVVLVISFLALFRADATQRGLVAPGAALAAFAVLSGLVGLGARGGDPTSADIRSISLALSAVEPVASLGSALLAVLALGALSSRRATAITVGVGVSIATTLGFRLVRLVASGPRSLSAAWISWLFEVARPVAIALFALGVARAISAGAASKDPGAGPYRGPAKDAPAPAKAREVPDDRTATKLRDAASAISLYRLAFFLRIGAAVLTTLFMLFAVLSRHNDDGLFALVLSPLSSLGTAMVMAAALAKLLALPRASSARGVAVAALAAVALVGLADVATLALALDTSTSSSASPYRAARDLRELVMAEWPVAAFGFGMSMLFMAGVLRRIGEKVHAPDVVGHARWLQGSAVVAGVALLGFILSFAAVQARRWDDTGSSAGDLVCVVIFIFGAISMITVLTLQAIVLVEARDALRAYADGG